MTPPEPTILQVIINDHRSGRTTDQQLQQALAAYEYMTRFYESEAISEA